MLWQCPMWSATLHSSVGPIWTWWWNIFEKFELSSLSCCQWLDILPSGHMLFQVLLLGDHIQAFHVILQFSSKVLQVMSMPKQHQDSLAQVLTQYVKVCTLLASLCLLLFRLLPALISCVSLNCCRWYKVVQGGMYSDKEVQGCTVLLLCMYQSALC